MAIKVGINGFGRIGRNIMRAALDDDGRSISSRSTTSPTRRRWRTCSKYDSVLGNLDRDDRGHGRRHHRRRRRVQGAGDQGPGAAAVEGPRRRRRLRVDRQVHQARRCGEAPRGWREEGHHHGAGDRAGRHARARRQRRGLRQVEAPRDFERVVHDQLPGAGGQGRARELRHQQGVDDDGARLHQRSEPARPAAQGSAARARRGDVDHPDDDRRGKGGRRSAARAEGQARRHRDARADAERLGRRSGGAGREKDDGRGGQRGAEGGGRRPAQGHPAVLDRAARLDRLPPQPALVDRRRRLHQGDGRRLRQGAGLVRQRVGLLEPLRRSAEEDLCEPQEPATKARRSS